MAGRPRLYANSAEKKIAPIVRDKREANDGGRSPVEPGT